MRGVPNNRWGRLGVIASVLSFIFVVAFSTFLFEQVDADEIVVIQSVTGNLVAHTSAGPKVQLFGQVTSYPKRETYSFVSETRFNDGGAGTVTGSIDWIMPLATQSILNLHQQYGSSGAISQNLVAVTTDKAVYMTGPLLSSTESYASRRTDLISWIEDQIDGGIFQTVTEQVRETNQLTGEEQTITVASIRTDDSGIRLRQEEAYLASFDILTSNFAVKSIDYDGRVQSQIDEQQANIMRVQTAQSEAREAEQRRITVEQQGLADAAQARATQEVLRAQAVTAAEQSRDVQALATIEAEFYREEQVLIGQGDAERKRLTMQADGALEQKLAAWLASQEVWAAAFSGYTGQLVPTIVTGGSAEGGNAALSFMEIMGVRAAQELAVSVNPGGN